MRSKTLTITIMCGLAIGSFLACNGRRNYKREFRIGRPIELRPLVAREELPFKTSPFAANENCMEGNYDYVYETESGMHGHEVWLCCVPIDELLEDYFHCADTGVDAFLSIPLLAYPQVSDQDYIKVRYCRLIDATSTELIYMPACIPAPLEAPNTNGMER